MTATQIRGYWLATVLLSIPLITAVPVWPWFLTAQLIWGTLSLLVTALAIRTLRKNRDDNLAQELFSVLIGLGIGLIISQIFSNT